MLTSLSIAKLAIADDLDIDLFNGMSAITGETGAGKSISLDALGLALGNRGDSALVQHGAAKAEVNASFDISQQQEIQQWLAEYDLDDEQQCILRRIISKDGRSKAYINGSPVNLQQLKTLGAMLVNIHSQHAHQQLLQRDHHQHLLDAFGKLQPQAEDTKQAFKQWQQTCKTIEQLQNSLHESTTRQEYLQFQLQEFEELAINDGEYEQLEAKHLQLANSEAIAQATHAALHICQDGEQNIQSLLTQAQQQLSQVSEHSSQLSEALELLNSAYISIDESCNTLKHSQQSGGDNEALAMIEQRLGAFHDLARKHRVEPSQLLDAQFELQTELDNLNNSDSNLQQLQATEKKQAQALNKLAQKLSEQRTKAASKLTKAIDEQLQKLGMKHCTCNIALNTNTEKPKATGFEQTEFLISTNPGQPAQPLQKIASGGELSRISLAIQVITAQTSTVPTLVFDEVDVGIGGATADIVGQLLSQLGKCAQIISVTHQAQVAAHADQHYLVSKQSDGNKTSTQMQLLDDNERIEEVARMLGGVSITEATLEHAREMLTAAS